MPMRYYDFDLLIEHVEQKFRARVVNSPSGQAAVDFSLPFAEEELKQLLEKIETPSNGLRRLESPAMTAAKTFGARLFEAVFDGEVRGRLRSSLEKAERRGDGLRFRLRIAAGSEFANLPWEYLYDPYFDQFFSLSVKTPIVRYLELPQPTRPLAVKPPIKILVMLSSPQDYPRLNVEQEWANLNEALQNLQDRGVVILQRLEQASLEALQRQLFREQYHIFHFIGHGEFDADLQDGVILLEDENKAGLRINGQCLGILLHDHFSLRLAILNACDGARTARQDHFAGTAQSLVQKGIPAVIAMQFGITDKVAILFAQTFYRALADGRPLDTALAETRQTLFNKGNEIEWGIPVLYMRSPNGRIFDVTPAAGVNGAAPALKLNHQNQTPNDQHDMTALFVQYLQAGTNGLAADKALRQPWSPDQEIFRQMFRAKICLSLLHYLDGLSALNASKSLTELCEALDIPKPQRQHTYRGLECLAAMQLVEKITATPHVTWRIAAKGRELVKKLSETVLNGETRSVG